ncbi:ribonuclease H-like domain-containing protein [Tanacetum coccineum]
MAVENKPSNLSQLCNHFNRGSCKFRDWCKFIHDHRNRAELTPRTFTNRNTASGQGSWGSAAGPTTFGFQQARQAQYPVQSSPMHYQPSPAALVTPVYYVGPIPAAQHAAPNQPQPTSSAQQPTAYTTQQQFYPVQPNRYDILGAAPALYPSHATSLPSAFSTMTLQDPTWNMDTGATSYLTSNARNLSTIFNTRLFPSIHVGDGNSIPNFLTRHILIRCDSSGNLYPVTKPSTLPAAFLSTSSSMWHQPLGHPGDEVLRSLVSRQFISCNKEKSSHICHACQLGKHVKLPFHSSDSIDEHCFDIIHSDL